MISAEQIAVEIARYCQYRHPVVFPAAPLQTLSTYQKVYLLSIPERWYLELFGQRVAEVLLTDISVDRLNDTEDMYSQAVSQLAEVVISELQEVLDYPLTMDQQHNLLTALSSQRHALQSLVDLEACHELPIGSVQLPVFDGFFDILPCLKETDERELPRDECRFWQLVSAQVYTDELGREIVRSQTQPLAAVRPDLQECLRYLEVDQTLPSLISKLPEAKQDIDFYTRLACVQLAPGQAYETVFDL